MYFEFSCPCGKLFWIPTKRIFDKIGNACTILSNQTKFPLCPFATAPSIHHISDQDHRICKKTKQFLSPASNPPPPPHARETTWYQACISPHGNQAINSPFIYQELLPKENHSSAVTYGKKEREDFTREKDSRERGENRSFCSLGRWRQSSSLIHSLPQIYALQSV